MKVNRKKIKKGFSLAEAMLAMLFISIGLFAYISLHARIIYSNSKLEARQLVKEVIATNMANKSAEARAGKPTSSGLVPYAPPPPVGANSNNGPGGSSSGGGTAASGYAPYSTNTGYAESQAMKDSNNGNSYPQYQGYNNSKPVDAPGVLEGGFTLTYDEGQRTVNPTGLPTGLNLVQTSAPYSDRNGQHTYYVDYYERTALSKW